MLNIFSLIHITIVRTMQVLEQSIRELEERKRAFDQERHDWENSNGVTLDELRRRSLEASSKE